MAARAIWKGSLNFGGEDLPVKLYSAVEDRTVHFNVLEKSTLSRVKQKLIHPETGEEVPHEQIKKGYEAERGVYVLLTDDELGSLQPPESRQIEITRFVPAAHVGPEWYDRPYYLGPDGNVSPAYFALAQALEREKREGIARWTMRKRRYVGALRSEGGYLTLMTVRFAEEVISVADLPRPSGRATDAKELKMAEQLVLALEDEFRPQDFRDEYRERLMKFIEAKAAGHKLTLQIVARKKQPESLVKSLAASIEAAKRQKGKAVA